MVQIVSKKYTVEKALRKPAGMNIGKLINGTILETARKENPQHLQLPTPAFSSFYYFVLYMKLRRKALEAPTESANCIKLGLPNIHHR